jgi:hypothetical protein
MYRNAGSAGRAHRAVGKAMRGWGGIAKTEPPPAIEPGPVTRPGDLATAAKSARRAILLDPAVAAEAAETALTAAAWHTTEARRFAPGTATRAHHEDMAQRFLFDSAEFDQTARGRL